MKEEYFVQSFLLFKQLGLQHQEGHHNANWWNCSMWNDKTLFLVYPMFYAQYPGYQMGKQAHISVELNGTCQFYHKCFQD